MKPEIIGRTFVQLNLFCNKTSNHEKADPVFNYSAGPGNV